MRWVFRGLLTAGFAVLAITVLSRGAEAAIYWETGDAIGRANLDGTNVQRAFFPIERGPGSYTRCGGVAVDGAYLYWANTTRNAVGRANLDGSSPNFEFIPTPSETCGVAVDGSHLYWSNSGGTTIGRAELDGSDVAQNFIDGATRPCAVAIDAAHVFWGNLRADWIGRANLDGNEIDQEFIKQPNGGCGIAIAGNHIYWADLAHSIARANLDGSEVDEEFITGLERPCGLAVEDGQIFWAEDNVGEEGEIGSANLDGTAVNRKLVPKVADPCGIAVDDRLVPPPPPGPPPLRHVSFGRVRHSKTKPVTFVALRVPQAGSVKVLVQRNGVGWRLASGQTDLPHGGRWWLKLAPSGPRSTRRRLLWLLRREGRLIVPVRVEYATDGQITFTPRKTFLLLPPSSWRD